MTAADPARLHRSIAEVEQSASQRRLAWFTDAELAAEIERRAMASASQQRANRQADAVIEALTHALPAEPDRSHASCTHLLTEHSREPGIGCLVYLSPKAEGDPLSLCPCTHPGTSDADQ